MFSGAIQQLQDQINEINDSLSLIKKSISSANIDHQMYLRSNPLIPPGIACKVGYDKNGLIINGDRLTVSDIPELPIMKINGLQEALNRLQDNIDVSTLVPSKTEVSRSKSTIKNTGIKVNYDEDGRIVSSSELIVDDIPMLPIEKIIGLKDQLDFLKQHHTEDNNDISMTSDVNVNPGTFPKISYDNHGRVIGGSNLTINDIPIEIIARITNIESQIPNFANSKVVENISMTVNNKVDSNNPISPGVYTKVKVDSKGLITGGDKINVNDIPILPITSIDNLDTILGEKAYQSDLEDISNTVSKLVSTIGKISEINTLKEIIGKKANDSDMKTVITRMDDIQNLFTELQSKIPNELIMDQIQQIQNEVSVLSGRISVLERKIQ